MKKLIILSSLLLLASCEEEVASYDKLTADEQEAIRNMGSAQCLTKVTENFETFKSQSSKIYTSGSFNRGDGFEFLFKNGTTTTKSMEIKVWKQTATEIFFYVTNTNGDGVDYFLHYPLATNTQIIEDLKALYCSRADDAYTSSISSGSLTMKDKKEYIIPQAPNKAHYQDTYSLYFTEPAFFANFRTARTKKIMDQDGRQVGNTESFTSTITAKTYTFAENNPEDPNDYNQKYCTLNRGTAFKFARERNIEGFKIDLAADCLSAKPPGWNMAI